ncbi:MAG: ribonuclease R [Thiotrichaceae bacterium]|nr:ribonuclease R [Thiotrichaceae bacterium]
MKYKDPHRKREAEKYGRPIPSREFILEVLDKASQPLVFRKLCGALDLTEDADCDALKYRLRAMERDGQLLFNRRRQYVPVSKADLIAGKVIGHPDGFGFLVPDEGDEGDLFLSSKQMRQLLHGDHALASVTGVDRKGRREGAIVEVIGRNTEEIVGRFFHESGVGFVIPDNKRISQDIVIPVDNINDAKNGEIVVAAIVEQPTRRGRAIGKIMEILGDHMGPGMEIDIALRSHDLPYIWPEAVDKECAQLKPEVATKDKKGRLDLRDIPLVTIDGADSRDFDDAVFCEPVGDQWRLLVAIADVSHYVKPETALDQEAWNRGTSVYFPAKVIPMLPEILSNGLCSLNPQTDRLCMVCEVMIDQAGEVIKYEFHEGVMYSHARLTYDQVASIVVDKDEEARAGCDVVDHLDNLYQLYKVLKAQRTKRGAINFESNETRIIYGKDRKIDKIIPITRNDAHKLIEECMITANVCAARFMEKHKLPNLHRDHPLPDPAKVEELRTFLGMMSLSLSGGDKPHAKDYTNILKQIEDRPESRLINTVLLRSMSQASYSPSAEGHFGLALENYAHFTSPIRRYPDLLIHRGIRHIINGGTAKDFYYKLDGMVALGEHCSTTERRAEDASRDVDAWLKAEFMLDKVGQVFDGIITAVTNFGLFVELNDIYVEGLVHVTALDSDYYHYDPIAHVMTGERTGRQFRLGSPMQIQVARVDLDERKIDFVLPGAENKPPQKKKTNTKGKVPPKKGAKPKGEKPKAKPRKRSRKRKPKKS